jgi:hypothetical protein
MTAEELKAAVLQEALDNGGDNLLAICTILAPYLSAGGKVTGLDVPPPLGQAVSDNENPG